jgi:23S rRNA G2445 N2-methylase RlmL
LLSYNAQALNRIVLLIDEFDFIDYDDLLAKIKSMDKDSMVDVFRLIKEGSYRTLAKIQDDEVYDIPEIEKTAGSVLFDALSSMPDPDKPKIHVDLKNPDSVFYIFISDATINDGTINPDTLNDGTINPNIIKEDTINDDAIGNPASDVPRYKHFYIGLDFSGDISKREYRIFNSSMSLKGTTAFGLLKMAGYGPKDILLDPSCNSGTICIEAALYSSKLSPRFYSKRFPFTKFSLFKDADIERFFRDIDEKSSEKKLSITAADTMLRNISAAKKNAKIAGVEKLMEFRRIDTDWLDLKFEKDSIDKIITFNPGSSKYKDGSLIKKFYKELFYQSEYVLKDEGFLVILCLKKELLIEAGKEHFQLMREESYYSGDQLMHVLFFRKSGFKK